MFTISRNFCRQIINLHFQLEIVFQAVKNAAMKLESDCRWAIDVAWNIVDYYDIYDEVTYILGFVTGSGPDIHKILCDPISKIINGNMQNPDLIWRNVFKYLDVIEEQVNLRIMPIISTDCKSYFKDSDFINNLFIKTLTKWPIFDTHYYYVLYNMITTIGDEYLLSLFYNKRKILNLGKDYKKLLFPPEEIKASLAQLPVVLIPTIEEYYGLLSSDEFYMKLCNIVPESEPIPLSSPP